MTDPVDLDRLDALHAAATPARWSVKHNAKHEESRVYAGTNQRAVFDGRLLLGQHEDAELAVALHNAWPAISAELRRLRAENEKLRAERDGAVRHALSTLDKQGDDDGN